MTDLEPLIYQGAFTSARSKLKSTCVAKAIPEGMPLYKRITANLVLASDTGVSLESVPFGFLYSSIDRD
jgi:hypothetical protein